MITFFLPEIMALPENFLKALAFHNDLSSYRRFFLRLLTKKPHILSEPEERMIKRKNFTGRDAFRSLYDELLGLLSFTVEIEGKSRRFGAGQAGALLTSYDRTLREKTFNSLYEELARQGMVFKNIFNSLILAHDHENMERGYLYPMHRMNLLNEIDEYIVADMMNAVEAHYSTARRYFRLKAGCLGLEKLKNTDILAPLKKEGLSAGFSKARKLIGAAMGKAHPLFNSVTEEFFKKNRIHAEPGEGKKEGAFCKCLSPSPYPYISINYSGGIKDLLTLAHELGHGIHYHLASRKSYLNFQPSPLVGETAATFFETLVIRHLMEEAEMQVHRPELIASHMEALFITIFRQNALTRFEQAVHKLRHDHLLSEEELCQCWLNENYKLYGKDVEMIPAYRWGWTNVPHFIHHHFYCYSYVFGNLLSIILFQKYLEQGNAFIEFIETFINLLGAGSSRTLIDMLEDMDLDPRKESFWEQPFQYIDGLVDDFEKACE